MVTVRLMDNRDPAEPECVQEFHWFGAVSTNDHVIGGNDDGEFVEIRDWVYDGHPFDAVVIRKEGME